MNINNKNRVFSKFRIITKLFFLIFIFFFKLNFLEASNLEQEQQNQEDDKNKESKKQEDDKNKEQQNQEDDKNKESKKQEDDKNKEQQNQKYNENQIINYIFYKKLNEHIIIPGFGINQEIESNAIFKKLLEITKIETEIETIIGLLLGELENKINDILLKIEKPYTFSGENDIQKWFYRSNYSNNPKIKDEFVSVFFNILKSTIKQYLEQEHFIKKEEINLGIDECLNDFLQKRLNAFLYKFIEQNDSSPYELDKKFSELGSSGMAYGLFNHKLEKYISSGTHQPPYKLFTYDKSEHKPVSFINNTYLQIALDIFCKVTTGQIKNIKNFYICSKAGGTGKSTFIEDLFYFLNKNFLERCGENDKIEVILINVMESLFKNNSIESQIAIKSIFTKAKEILKQTYSQNEGKILLLIINIEELDKIFNIDDKANNKNKAFYQAVGKALIEQYEDFIMTLRQYREKQCSVIFTGTANEEVKGTDKNPMCRRLIGDVINIQSHIENKNFFIPYLNNEFISKGEISNLKVQIKTEEADQIKEFLFNQKLTIDMFRKKSINLMNYVIKKYENFLMKLMKDYINYTEGYLFFIKKIIRNDEEKYKNIDSFIDASRKELEENINFLKEQNKENMGKINIYIKKRISDLTKIDEKIYRFKGQLKDQRGNTEFDMWEIISLWNNFLKKQYKDELIIELDKNRTNPIENNLNEKDFLQIANEKIELNEMLQKISSKYPLKLTLTDTKKVFQEEEPSENNSSGNVTNIIARGLFGKKMDI
jgi:hypothetical protein